MGPASKVALVLASLLVVEVNAARRRHRANATSSGNASSMSANRQGAELEAGLYEKGIVDEVYTFGAPGSASPGLKNQRPGATRCFPGLRIWLSEGEDGWFMQKWIDFVPRLTNLRNWWHPQMATGELSADRKGDDFEPCSDGEMYQPNSNSLSDNLHFQAKYIEVVRNNMGGIAATLAYFAADPAYVQDLDRAAIKVQQKGWGLVGSGIHEGGSAYGGRQVSHLIQHPQTLECVVTFQGTASAQGWLSNADASAAHFCGFVERDENCHFTLGTCRPRGSRSSFIHRGFVHRIRSIIQTQSWQENVRPNLPFCSKVYATGHSLGAAVSELFTGCVLKAPSSTSYGWEDYMWMGWTKETPKRLPYKA